MKKQLNRWFYAVIGVLVLLTAGMVYAWSVLSGPIAAEFPEWSKADLSLTFTIVMTMFCIGCMIGGFLSGHVSTRVYVWTAAGLMLAGFLLTASMHSLIMLYIGFGVICGFGAGLCYSAVMGTISRWFPDKQGLISGILLMGFGLSSFIVGKLYQAFTPDVIGAWRSSFVFMGIVTAVVLAICGFFVVQPSIEFMMQFMSGNTAKYDRNTVEYTPKMMLKSPAFWLYYLWAVMVSMGGLALVSQATGIAREVGTDISPSTITTVVGLISIANACGRVIFGSLYDTVGRWFVMHSVNMLFIVAAGILMVALDSACFPILVVGFLVGGAAYGGVTPTNSAFISNYFGMQNFAINFSLINTNLILASFGSTIAGSLYDATSSYMSTYLMMALLGAAGILAALGISLCGKQKKTMQK